MRLLSAHPCEPAKGTTDKEKGLPRSSWQAFNVLIWREGGIRIDYLK
jgi:hypothetical protein